MAAILSGGDELMTPYDVSRLDNSFLLAAELICSTTHKLKIANIKKNSRRILIKTKIFLSRKSIRKCLLQNGSHLYWCMALDYWVAFVAFESVKVTTTSVMNRFKWFRLYSETS